MNIAELAVKLGWKDLTSELAAGPAPDISRGYVSDLLSDVLANAPDGGVLVTAQVHMNVVAVCVHAGVAAVVFVAGREPEEPVRARAVAEGIRLYSARECAFDVVGALCALGIKGGRE